jgi:murein DD-endopeptidase MepM/ murein hydrolase activator NlpD
MPLSPRRSTALALLVLVVWPAGPFAAAPAAAATDSGSGWRPGAPPGAVRYRPPVEGPVIDPFRPPAGPYGPGNRGLEYATVAGAPAVAIGAGVVVFAGPVAGRGVVSVVHPDGLRSSLTGLVAILVRPGQVVGPGTIVGTTGTRLHLGVRSGDRYIDPAQLFGPGRPRHAVLVPTR